MVDVSQYSNSSNLKESVESWNLNNYGKTKQKILYKRGSSYLDRIHYI